MPCHHNVIGLNPSLSIHLSSVRSQRQQAPLSLSPAPLGGSRVVRWDTSIMVPANSGSNQASPPSSKHPENLQSTQEAFSSDVRTASAGSFWCEGAAALLPALSGCPSSTAHLESRARPLLSAILFFWSLLKFMAIAECWKPDQPVRRKLQIPIHHNSPAQGLHYLWRHTNLPVHLKLTGISIFMSERHGSLLDNDG